MIYITPSNALWLDIKNPAKAKSSRLSTSHLIIFAGRGRGLPEEHRRAVGLAAYGCPYIGMISYDDARIAGRMGIQTYMKLRLAKEMINIKAQLGRRPKNHIR